MAQPSTANGGFPSVVITGMAMMTSLAPDVEGTWQGLLNSESGIHVLEDDFVAKYNLSVRIGGHLKVRDFDKDMTEIEHRRLSYVQRMATFLGRQVWQDAGAPENIDLDRLAVSVGTGLGGPEKMVEAYDQMRAKGTKAVSPLAVQMFMPNGPAAVIGLERKARGGVITPVSACASGNEGIAHAWRQIAYGDADIAICGGVETLIEAVPIAAFANMRIVLSTDNDNPAGASRPFDKNRTGFVFGEGGALMVIETEEHAKARGARIYARLLGAGITSDGFHVVAPHPDGIGAGAAITRALQTAGLDAQDIDHVNAHATATSVGDIAEANAIKLAGLQHAAVYAPKGALGHSVGAVGAVEAIITVKSLQEGIIAPTLNYQTPDPQIDLDIVSTAPRKGNYTYAINNSFGFGGHNVAIALGRY
ncbi:KasA/KasB family beta-ketoacyl-ACP synthase [Mycobacteroides abscessus]|uniref:KasA/KasB family beta-ketoacyl-ACP synthase n=1 Tax=Mycobacteroides abscessus TaxID=36809 RepID=UPI000241C508|nr:KasA/KasB family beta-ketoacyl-ACP synthase [Mycobacteroides abscessus]EHM21709.1 3-oxoacyl-(acyl carrier protein) synthase II [Mycobacteroides abscessus subsp. massiliense CCUG 48898 = JCM 15300]EIV69293.1 3-oxoacyl-[acyl-carrier-protein] synthase 1 [Mycobacteroides abscessus subsp. massiliense CCUG 48898 = JCM 15300]MDM2402565.1 KasA/KasB family beta-ketoacyl-ACP synthase [Mycobacteroides abscessus]MDM2412870.1 KasA/KasB family beta-ketoacyl-ACP synthase [Mycobacteroides abscessus]ORA8816